MAENKYIKIIGCSLLLVAVTLATGCSKEEKVARFLSDADRLMAEGDPVRAILQYKNALQIDLRNLPALLGLASAYTAQKDYQNAFSAYRSALEIDPGCDKARIEVAWLLAMGNRGQMALDELSKVKNIESHQPKANIIRARALISLERFQDAIDVLSACREAATSKEIQALLALCFKKSKDHPSMIKAAEQWRRLDPKDPSSYVFLAQFSAERGDSESAALEIEKMVEAAPSDTERLILRARVFERLGMMAHAERAYEELGGGRESLITKADFWIRRNNLEKARTLLDTLLESDPGDIDAIIRVAQIHVDQSALESALKLLERGLEQDMKRADRERLLVAKATLSARQGERRAAMDICKKLLRENQGNIDAHLLLGKILLSDRNTDKAEVHLAQAAAARPADEDAHILLARCQFLNNNDAMAVDTLMNALEANPRSTRLRIQLFRHKTRKKEFDQALRVLDKGIELQPNDVSILKARGEFLASRQSWARAEDDFRKLIKLQPDMPLGYMELGRLRLRQSRPDEAIPLFKEALKKENGWQQAVPALMAAYAEQGDKSTALSIAKTEVEKRPDSPLAQLYLGQAYDMLSDFSESEKAFSRAMELAPDWPAPYQELTGIYVKEGRIDEVIARLEKESEKGANPLLWLQLAILYEHAERYENAARMYTALIENGRSTPDILNNLAYIYAEHSTGKDQLDKAAELIESALAEQPRNPAFLDTAAWIAYKQGKLDSAWDYIAQELQADSSYEGVHRLHAAIILNDRGDRQQALATLDRALQQRMDDVNQKKAQALKREWMEQGGE